jgi:hypothetical protein
VAESTPSITNQESTINNESIIKNHQSTMLYGSYRLNNRLALVPPKPNEFESA